MAMSAAQSVVLSSVKTALVVVTFLATCQHALTTEVGEYCQYETFEATCPKGQVIVIKSAQYGRMKIGRCVKSDFGFIGCYADVTRHVDRKCSGRQKCSVKVVDPSFENIHPCNEEFKNYLETTYDCVDVVKSQEYLCSRDPHKALPSSGYISSALPSTCGASGQPYTIKLPAGQKLNLSLLDFHLPLSTEPHAAASNALRCDVYATVREPSTRRTVDVCGGQSRQNTVFVSTTSSVEIYMNEKMSEGNTGRQFLIKYDVVGCPDLDTPADAWMERDGDKAIVGCNDNDQVWRLRCQGTTWIGHIGNCSAVGEVQSADAVVDVMSLPTGMLIAIVIGIACVISFSILLLGVYYLRRYINNKRKNQHKKNITYYHHFVPLSCDSSMKSADGSMKEGIINASGSMSSASSSDGSDTYGFICSRHLEEKLMLDKESYGWLCRKPAPVPTIHDV